MSLKLLNDQELVSSYLEGNHKAFETLLFRHKNKIYRLIYLKVKDKDLAEDLFQDTFIKIINTIQLGNYNDEGKFLPWALRIAHNLVIDYFRKSNKIKVVREFSTANEDFSIFSVIQYDEDSTLLKLSKNELIEQIKSIIHHLPKEQKEIIHYRLYEDLSFKEIAEMKNISINTALGRMRYAIINLRKIIEENKLVIEI
jgi:RNA polymerase sigma-70 factor (ECF subfamily)